MSRTVQFPTAKAFIPLVNSPSRYLAVYGGRGSGKSHFFSEQLIRRCTAGKTRAVCIREVQNTIKDSVKQLLVDKIQKFNLGGFFEIRESEIRGANGSLIIFKGMQKYNAQNIKSLEGFDIAWVEEAQTLSQISLDLLRPTIRNPGSQIWFSWNPRHDSDPVDVFLRGDNLPDGIVVQANWHDNPWFPDVLEQERLYDKENAASRYGHIWRGDYLRDAGGVFERSWFKIIDDFPRDAKGCRYYDLAGSVKSASNPDPDYTAGPQMFAKDGIYYITGLLHFRDTPLGTETKIKAQAVDDGRFFPIWMQQDPGQAGKAQVGHYSRNVLKGYTFRGHNKGRKTKLVMADPVAAAAEAGNVYLVRRTSDGYGLTPEQIKKILNELELFPEGPHDDIVDGITGAFDRLNTKKTRKPITGRTLRS